MDRDNGPQKKHMLQLFGVIAASILFYFVLLRFDQVSGVLDMAVTALNPLILGIALAYILRPLALKLERMLSGKKHAFRSGARIISVAVTVTVAVGLVTLFCFIVIPQLTESITTLVRVVPGQIRNLMQQLEEYTQNNEDLGKTVNQIVLSIQAFADNWVQNEMLGSVTALIGNAMALLTGVVNLIIAVVVTVYVLLGWERYIAQMKKLFLALSKHQPFNSVVFDTMAQVNRIFSGFITGKLVDSLIVGIICFIFMTIVGLPYTLLISFIIGLTNIIPMFGPFIGAIPSAFLILLVDPVQCLIFIIFILVLQQIDGNIIGPRILGNTTGLSALYVTIAILLFGKLMGFIGMVIGVPLFATIYYLVKRYAEEHLRQRNFPTETDEYIPKSDK